MNRPLAVAGLLLALAMPSYAVPAGRTGHTHHSSGSTTRPKVYVRGYYRKDGTYVPPHYRSAPGTVHATSAPRTPSANRPRPPTPASPHTGGCTTCPRDASGRILRSPAARARFMRQTGYPHGRPGYVVDHIVSLECGGADDPSNMQWQTIAAAKAKDRTERNCRR